MKLRFNVVLSIVKKDTLSLLWLILPVIGLFVIEAIVFAVEFEIHPDTLLALDTLLPGLCLFSLGIVTIASIQEDPASSLNHDWLTRPISGPELFLAKVLFLLSTIGLPI
ncbi:MAG: hypothetical protein O7G84_13005, partial [Gammaproteobacteria bacterium]|nr:hypothetical protein [Gammaproteobacteria bacterium]